jgi:hypothetical protein
VEVSDIILDLRRLDEGEVSLQPYHWRREKEGERGRGGREREGERDRGERRVGGKMGRGRGKRRRRGNRRIKREGRKRG